MRATWKAVAWITLITVSAGGGSIAAQSRTGADRSPNNPVGSDEIEASSAEAHRRGAARFPGERRSYNLRTASNPQATSRNIRSPPGVEEEPSHLFRCGVSLVALPYGKSQVVDA